MSKQAKIDVTINGEQAKARLAEIKDDLRQIKVLRDKAAAEGDVKGYSQLNGEMKKLTTEARRLEKANIDVNSTLKDISSASVRELSSAYRQAKRDMDNMKRTDPGFGDQQKKVNALKNELDKATGYAKKHQSTLGKLAGGFNQYFGMATAAIASFTGVILGFRKAADDFDQFEKRVDVLSSLTGLIGDELAYLTDEAKRMSTATIEGNVRITQSADAIVDAYTKVGSARPELLKSKEDLAGVTQEAMILAAAADSELQPAVDALAGVLNQFNYRATESRRIINTIAAGSKEGAGEIPYLTEAIEKSGTVAKDAGIEIEELVGIIETMAPRIAAPEMAGRNLRAIILKLQEGADDTNPAIVGFSQAIENLAAKNLTAAEYTKLFGLENVTAAKILVNNREEMDNYTKAVTGTNVALEQAAINTDNNITKKKQALNDLKLITMELGEKLSPAIVMSTNSFTYLVKAMMYLPEFIKKYQIALIILTGAILAHNAAVIKSAAVKAIDFIWTKNLIAQYIRNTIILNAMVVAEQLKTIWTGKGTIATKIATTAQYAWNTAMKANPIGLVIAAVTALITAIKLYDKYNKETIRIEEIKQRRIQDVKDANDKLRTSYNAQQNIIRDVNKLSKDRVGVLLKETEATIGQAEAELRLAIIRQELTKEENTKVSLWERVVNQVTSFNNSYVAAIKNQKDAAENGKKAAAEMQESIDNLKSSLADLKTQKSDLTQVFSYEDTGDKIVGQSLSELEDKLQNYRDALRTVQKDSADFERIQTKIAAVNQEIARVSKTSSDGIVDDVETQLDAYDDLKNEIAAVEKEIRALVAANQPVPDSLIHQLIAKKSELEKIEETVKNIGQGIAAMSLKKAGITIDQTQGLAGGMRDSAPEMVMDLPTSGDDKDKRKELALNIANSTQNAIFDIIRNKREADLDHQISILDKQREAELKNTSLTEEQKDAINEKYRKKEAAIKLEAWKKQKNADLLQAIVKGALAVISALPNVALSIATGVAAAAEIAVIASTKPPEFKGGGFTDEDTDDEKPVGVVHANEFVATAAAVRNPQVKKILDVIDYAQKAGTIRTLNLPAIVASSKMGLKDGGYSSTDTGAPVAGSASVSGTENNREMITAMHRFSDAVDRLQRDGIEAKSKWVYLDFKKMEDKEASAKSITG